MKGPQTCEQTEERGVGNMNAIIFCHSGFLFPLNEHFSCLAVVVDWILFTAVIENSAVCSTNFSVL